MKNKYCWRKIARCGAVVVVLFMTSVGAVEAQSWFHKKIWFTRQDSVPVYKEKRVGSDTVDFIKPWKDLDLRADHNNQWVMTLSLPGKPQAYIPVSELGYYLSGNRNYEILADSVAGTIEVYNPVAQGVVARSIPVVLHKGDVVKLNRVYKDYYAYHLKQVISMPAVEVKLPKDSIVPTEAQPTVFFRIPKDFEKQLKQDWEAAHPVAEEPSAWKDNYWFESRDNLIAGILLVLVTIACLVGFYFVHMVWFNRMYRDRSKSNVSISALSLVGGGALMFVAGNCLWILTSGFTALWVAAGCLLVYIVACARVEHRLDRRCRKCANYMNVSYLGVTKDGTKWEYDHVHNYYVKRYWDGDQLVEERVNRNEWLRHQYQMYAFNYRCDECGHEWKVRFKGELIASGKRVEEEVEETKFG